MEQSQPVRRRSQAVTGKRGLGYLRKPRPRPWLAEAKRLLVEYGWIPAVGVFIGALVGIVWALTGK